MIDSIGLPSAVPAATPAVNIERPALIPEPAVRVAELEPVVDTALPNGATVQTMGHVGLDAMNPLEKALHLVNNNLEAWSTGMRFDLDPDAQRIVVSIIDSASGEVLRTVPSDAVIRVAKMIVQLQGKSIDTQA